MDLSARIRHAAFSRPRVLVVAAPAAVAVRLAVERYAREHGWPVAESAADADVLAVLGSLDTGLADVVSVLETQIPAPWTRVDLTSAEDAEAALNRVRERLERWRPPADSGPQTAHQGPGMGDWQSDGDAAAAGHGRHGPVGVDADPAGHHPTGHDDAGMASHDAHQMAGPDMAGHSGHDMAGHSGHDMAGHGGHDMAGHGGHDMAGHGGHDHGDMGPVAGLPMAGRAPDRDGLKLDVLHIPLGPVLPYWPSGLRLSLTLQGDVVQNAAVETLGIPVQPSTSFWNEPVQAILTGAAVTAGQVCRRRAAAHLDSLARLLGVAGWDDAAVRTVVLRDRALAGEPGGQLSADFHRLGRRLAGSRLLRRMLSGLGVLDGATADRLGVTGPAAVAVGDVAARLAQWVRAVAEDLLRVDDPGPASDLEGPRGRLDRAEPPSAALLAALPPLSIGAELAGVRLIVASLDPDLAELAQVQEAAVGG